MVLTTLLSCLSLSGDIDHSDDIVSVLQGLVLRDERLEEGKMKLGDKLVKWSGMEVEKMANPAKT